MECKSLRRTRLRVARWKSAVFGGSLLQWWLDQNGDEELLLRMEGKMVRQGCKLIFQSNKSELRERVNLAAAVAVAASSRSVISLSIIELSFRSLSCVLLDDPLTGCRPTPSTRAAFRSANVCVEDLSWIFENYISKPIAKSGQRSRPVQMLLGRVGLSHK